MIWYMKPTSLSLYARIREALGFNTGPVDPPPKTETWVIPHTDWRKLLTPDEMRQMAVICPPRPFRKGETIYRQGDPAHSLYILLEGHVKISLPISNGERVLAVVGPDDIFGESFLTHVQQRHSDAVCLSSKVIACPISKEQFLQVAEKVPSVMLTFATVLVERNRVLEEELRQAALPVEVRVGNVLLALADRFGTVVEPGIVHLKLDLKQEELGSMAGTSRVYTTKTLSDWRELGLVEGTRGEYRIRVNALREMIERLEVDPI